MSAGKVEIGCFRVFPDSYVDSHKDSKSGGGDGGLIPLDKQKDFGIHANRYYQLEHSFFKKCRKTEKEQNAAESIHFDWEKEHLDRDKLRMHFIEEI